MDIIAVNITNMLIDAMESQFLNTTNSTTEETEGEGAKLVPRDTFIGLVLAFSSCFFIGISVIFKKLALKDIEKRGGTRASEGGYGYLRIPRWWMGITLMALGELTNFVAYMFAPAILVTPLGVFSIVCTTALSPYFLKERLKAVGRLGCVLVLVGCVIVTLCGPKDREIATMDELQAQLLHQGFLIYASLAVSVSVILMFLAPRFGKKYVLVYVTICSLFGSLSVMFCKGVGLALKETIAGRNELSSWASWVCFSALIVCLLIETLYMQKALDLFSGSVFMSVNYVMFTSMVIIASSILYTELRELGIKNIVLTILGFVVNIVALYLLHIDRENDTQNRVITETKSTSLNEAFPPDCPSTPLMSNNNLEVVSRSEQYLPSFYKGGENQSKFVDLICHDSRKNTCINKNGLTVHPVPCKVVNERKTSSESITSNDCNTNTLYNNKESVKENQNKEFRKSLSEVPLITNLHSSSRIPPEHKGSSSPHLAQDKINAAVPSIISDDEGTRLV